MLTGFPPFYTKSREELFDNIKKIKLTLPPYFSMELTDLMMKLFRKDPNQRLGGGVRDAAEIKEHPWFKKINWDQLLKKQIMPPFTPVLKNELDLKYFDPVSLRINEIVLPS